MARNMDPYGKIGIRERLAYGMGDFGFNFPYGTVSTVYVFFLTDFIGISAVHAGWIILISRFFDGFTDVICGHLTKKTKTRWGRMRPWLLFLSIPLGISFFMMFVIPQHWAMTPKLIYIFIMYNLTNSIFGTGINLPFSAMLPLMSRDQHQRAMTQLFRLTLSPIGSLICSAFTLPLISRLGNDVRAWWIVVGIWAIVCSACLMWTALDCRERVDVDESEDESNLSLGQSVKLIFKNYYWWMCFLMWGGMNFIFATASTSVSYYTAHILKNTDWMIPMQVIERCSLILTILFIPFIAKKIGGKKPIVITGAVLVAVGQFMMLFAGDNVPLLLLNALTRGVGVAGFQGSVFHILYDVTEYAVWRDGVRQDGMIFSGSSIGSKVGGGLAGVAVGYIMAAYGYDGTAAVQTAHALTGIRMAFVWPPLVLAVILIVCMIPYKLDKLYPRIEKELRERESKLAEAKTTTTTES